MLLRRQGHELADVYALPDMVKAAALQKAATFDQFNENNDPHGEHDFGSFELCGRKFFWKVDYLGSRKAVRQGRKTRATRSDHARHDLLTDGDGLFFIQLYRWFPSVLGLRPETLVRWHRPASACTGVGNPATLEAGANRRGPARADPADER